ncbi:KH domain [Popillia japonica]|uniref:KH domain n=1 Tax=Popillia japonica TaxID=7064 RepID=A0AAW1IUS8_POPJA
MVPVDRVQENKGGEQRRMVDITRDKPIKVAVRVVVPVRDHPKFNFVGKLLGPKGNSLKRLQEDTMCKMAVLGRGSMKDRHKEEELRASGDPKFQHLSEELHVEISAFATPAEAHARIAYALAEVRRFLVPTNNPVRNTAIGYPEKRPHDTRIQLFGWRVKPIPPRSYVNERCRNGTSKS